MKTELTNQFFRARFDPDTGNLMELSSADEALSLVGRMFIQYHAAGGLCSEIHDNPSAISPEVVSVRRSSGAVSSVLRTPHLEIRRRFRVSPGSPLLGIRYEFISTTSVALHGPALLFLRLADDVNDVACDEKDLYFDGAELGSHRELPCWRVLYRKGYRRGVLVATRSKRMMSRLMYNGQAIEVRPHVFAQQQVDYSLREIPIKAEVGTKYVVEFEIGPWWSARHGKLLKAAALDRSVRVEAEESSAPADPPNAGTVFRLTDWVPSRMTADTFHERKWLRVALPWNRRQKALVANAGCRPPAFVVKPKMKGPCRVFVGGSGAASVGLQFSGDPYPIYRYGIGGTAFHSVLHGPDQARELDFGIVDLTGRTVRIVANHNGHWPARLDYLRIEPLSPDQAQAWQKRQGPPSSITIAGMPDCGDVFFNLVDRHRLDPRIIKGNLWEQARAGFNRVYWQMHGTYTGFHTRIGTRTPMVCRGHGAFEPQIKGRALFERKHDLLRLAGDTCRELGIEFWGMARLNSYMSGKRDRFFQDHPHYEEITEDGTLSGNRMCYAIPQVRDYHRSILVEAAGYGLKGIVLGALRHAPLLLYHPVLVGGYRARYGKLPPRDPGRHNAHHLHDLPTDDDEHRLWYAYRAEFMTAFARDLKRDLRDHDMPDVKISVWVRPNHCLFDGIDLETWLSEGLCDEVIADTYHDRVLDEPTPTWRRMVQSRVPLIRGIGCGELTMDAATLRRALTEGYDGICAYGSEQFPQTPANQPLLDVLRDTVFAR